MPPRGTELPCDREKCASAKKILYVCNDADYFLAHRAHVASRMQELGWDTAVAVGGRAGAVQAQFRTFPLALVRTQFSPTNDLKLTKAIRGAILEFRPDVVHLITMKPVVFGALALQSLPKMQRPHRVVATFPGLGRIFEPDYEKRAWERTITALVLRRLFRMADTYATFENESDRGTLLKMKVVSHEQAILLAGAGVPLGSFAPRPGRLTSSRHRVLWASRLLRGKGINIFREAAAQAGQRRLDIEFLVAGYRDPEHPDSLSESEAADLRNDPNITFLGHVQDMPKLLREVDSVCLPSGYKEGLPRILIEAAAAAVPSVASDQEGCRRVVVPGRTGLILPDTSAGSVLKAVERLADDPDGSRAMGAAARELVMSQGYDASLVQQRFLSLYTGDASFPDRAGRLDGGVFDRAS